MTRVTTGMGPRGLVSTVGGGELSVTSRRSLLIMDLDARSVGTLTSPFLVDS